MNICIKKYKILTNHEFDLCKECNGGRNCLTTEFHHSVKYDMDKINNMKLKILRYQKITRVLDIST